MRSIRNMKAAKQILLQKRQTTCALFIPKQYLSSVSTATTTEFIEDGDLLNKLTSKSIRSSVNSKRSPKTISLDETNTNDQKVASQSFVKDHVMYPGDITLPLTSELKMVLPGEDVPSLWPVFRIMDEDGVFRDSARSSSKSKITQHRDQTISASHNKNENFIQTLQPSMTKKEVTQNPLLQSLPTLLTAHRQLLRLRTMDHILSNAQRQGRISFYMSCLGEEAIHIGTASALTLRDTVFAQYREAGVLMWRGFTLDQFANQCFSNDLDLGRGRQMPVHYGSKALNYHTISSPLGTQIIQAVGAGYFYKNKAEVDGSGVLEGCAVVYFGDGSTSTSDFHAGCNFAATLDVPVVFVCRNNGFAISTPVAEQFRGDGIVCRAPGYGMAGCRVDGNDIFAVSAAMKEARRYAMEESKPVMLEVMTYRRSHHSTSDDSTRYRSEDEVDGWVEESDPVNRLDRFFFNNDIMDKKERLVIEEEERVAVLESMTKAEKRSKPDLKMLFEDVYKEKPDHLLQQEAEMYKHLEKYGKHYDDGKH